MQPLGGFIYSLVYQHTETNPRKVRLLVKFIPVKLRLHFKKKIVKPLHGYKFFSRCNHDLVDEGS
jgi:hypothetical protein